MQLLLGTALQNFCIEDENYSLVLPAALVLAQRAFCAATILARPAALMVLFFFTTGLAATGLAVLIFAHRAFCAAAILALPAALIPPFLTGLAAGIEVIAAEPMSEESCLVRASILVLMAAACLSWAEVNDSNVLMVI